MRKLTYDYQPAIYNKICGFARLYDYINDYTDETRVKFRFIDNGEWMNCFCDNKDIKLI